MGEITRFGELFLHDQKEDAVDTRYSVQTKDGGVAFLFNECGLTAREVFETFVLGADFTIKTAERGETYTDEIEKLRADNARLREDMQRIADHDRIKPGLSYPSLEALIDSAVGIAKNALNSHVRSEG